MTWTSAFGKGSGWLLQKIVNGLALSKISPNTLTFIGLLINILAAFFFGYARPENHVRMFVYAGLVIIGAGLFDMVDGRVARQTNQVSVFGAFFDSVLDRYSDVALFFGLLVFYARGNRFFYVVLAAFCMTASVMVSYTRARAEALIGSCKVGFMERPERIVLIILGALFNRWGAMAPALWVLAIMSTITVIHRIRYTYLETERRKALGAAKVTMRQIVEITLLAIVCVASLRSWFWKDPGFSPLKKLGLLLCLIVFVSVSLFILYH